ncbi:hypothetical protein JTB14_005150 [Gonioctena quinquepunctata]|nr:hypothetical protein JTB14_005150 [Gonioctena quinquepunctata]
MASSLPYLKIKLDKNDVPGASLQEKPIEAHSVTQLKRWLKCRGQKVGGKKDDLIERVNFCISEGIHEIDISIDKGRWFHEKSNALKKTRTILNKQNIPPLFPPTGWKKFPSKSVPRLFNYGIVYKHLVETAHLIDDIVDSEEETEGLGFDTSKPLRRGRIYFKSGHVKNLEDYANNEIYCLKSKVMSSYDEDTSYVVMIMLNQDSAEITDSSCECVASTMGRCSHVSGLLFALEDYVMTFGYEPPSCTSKLCEWNKGRTKKDPSEIYKKQYNHKICHNDKFSFHPYTDPGKSYDPVEVNNNLLSLLQKNKPTTGMSAWELLLDFKYDDYKLDSERMSILKENIFQFRQSLRFGFTIPNEVTGTKDQNEREKWLSLRRILITASNCKEFFMLAKEKYYEHLKYHMWFPKPQLRNKFVCHGLKYESEARKSYIESTGNHVETCGLWINPNYLGLGVTPDGIIYDPTTDEYGILEIKCPFVLKDFLPTELNLLTPSQRSAFCCSIAENNQMSLKHSHRYYFQIQMLMGILEKHGATL